MEMSTDVWKQVQETARGFLCRWSDRFTRNQMEDLVQETMVESYRSIAALRDQSRLEAYVRTIARRRRAQSLDRERRRRQAYERAELDPITAEVEADELWKIEGAIVSKDWLLSQLQGLLTRLTPASRALLRGYYEGMSCAELAERFSIPAGSVRKRIHRTRVRLRKMFQVRVRNTHGDGQSQDAQQ